MTARQWKELLGKSPYVLESKEGGIWFPARNMFDTAITGEIYPGDYDSFEEALAAASRSGSRLSPLRLLQAGDGEPSPLP